MFRHMPKIKVLHESETVKARDKFEKLQLLNIFI
jgi:hypothetical protein